MANLMVDWVTPRFLLLVILLGAGPAAADWVVYEAETDLTLSSESSTDLRPGANWGGDTVVRLNGGDPNEGWAALQLGQASNRVMGVRVRAGSGPDEGSFTDYTGAYKFYICNMADLGEIGKTPRDPCAYYEITLYQNPDTFEFYSDADNHVWMETPGEVALDADEAFVVTTAWEHGFCDAMRVWVDPCNCGDPGTVYLAEDLVPDCRVDMQDFAVVAGEYGTCTDPNDPCCTGNWGVLIEAEDAILGPGSFADYRPNEGWSNDYTVYIDLWQGAQGEGYAGVVPPAGEYEVGVRVRAGYGGDPGAINDGTPDGGSAAYLGTYTFWMGNYQISLYPDWDTFEYYSDPGNHVWMKPPSTLSFDGQTLFKVKTTWPYGFADVFEYTPPTPGQCGDLGTQYPTADLNLDCRANLLDVQRLADVWLHCTDPSDAGCDIYWKEVE